MTMAKKGKVKKTLVDQISAAIIKEKECNMAYSLGNLFISNFLPMALVSF